jgi:MoxR-like ATPase
MDASQKMTSLPPSIDAVAELLTSRGYLADRALSDRDLSRPASMGRPLFLEGEAGVGKTEIAKALSAALGRSLIRLQCYEGLDVASAVYEWNSAAQMIAIRLAEAAGDTDRDRLVARHLRRTVPDQAAAAAARSNPMPPVRRCC